MGEIVQFNRVKKIKPKSDIKPNRVEALVKGKVDLFVCDNCGAYIEVLLDKRPERCPRCNFTIDEWKDEL